MFGGRPGPPIGPCVGGGMVPGAPIGAPTGGCPGPTGYCPGGPGGGAPMCGW